MIGIANDDVVENFNFEIFAASDGSGSIRLMASLRNLLDIRAAL